MQVKAESTYRFLKGMSRTAKLAATFAVGAMSQKAKAYCVKMISLDDHTQKELDALGHPYALRHGPEGSGLHDPYQQVHTQSGALLDGLKANAPRATASGARAEVVNTDPKDAWIQKGTSVMIARPYMDYVKSAYAEEIIAAGSDELAARLTQAEVARSA